MGKGRMEAFSDGVLAIAITLLVLDIAVVAGDTPLHELWSAWPSCVGYVISFLTIGVAWLGHSALSDRLTHVDAVFLRLNLLFLLVVVFLPFPTKLVTEAFGDRDAERVAVTVYGLTLLMIRLSATLLYGYATRELGFTAVAGDLDLVSSRSKNLTGIVGYSIAIVVGLMLPGVAVAIYFAVALYLVIPFRAIARMRVAPGR